MRVLIVEDHTVLRQALAAALQVEPDLDVVGEAPNGRVGIDQTDRLQPDIVLMDINMPVMNGVDATRAIHAAHPEVCVIALSMHEGLRATMREAGAMAYVSKSDPMDDLIRIVRACYAERRRQVLAGAAA